MSNRRFFSNRIHLLHCFYLITILVCTVSAQRLVENLGRGVVAINKGSGNVYISWRLLGNDPSDIAFNIYRSTDDAAAVKLNDSPITATTDYSDKDVDITKSNAWFVKPIIGSVEQSASKSFTLPASAAAKSYISLPLKPLSGYTTLHVYVGDLDATVSTTILSSVFPMIQQRTSILKPISMMELTNGELTSGRIWIGETTLQIHLFLSMILTVMAKQRYLPHPVKELRLQTINPLAMRMVMA